MNRMKEIKAKMAEVIVELNPVTVEVVKGLEEYRGVLVAAGKARAGKRVDACIKILNDLAEQDYEPPKRGDKKSEAETDGKAVS